MCRTYTLGDVLSLRRILTQKLSEGQELKLERFLMAIVKSSYYLPFIDNFRTHHQRRNDFFSPSWKQLYHPCMELDIVLAMNAFFEVNNISFNTIFGDDVDWGCNNDSNIPLLVKAMFGIGDASDFNVTPIIRYLLRKQGNTRLIVCPSKVYVGRYRYWYIVLFGDPCYQKSKSLRITAKLKDGNIKTRQFYEDKRFSIALRARKL